MASVRVEGLRKCFGDVEALKGLGFEVDDGEFFSLLGPPNAGKTTTLRIIAGLERADEGGVWLGGENVDEVHPKDRDVAMVFEDMALYPHWTAFGNLAHPLRLRKMPEAAIRERVQQIAALLHIEHLLDRRPGTFSGGERRRVAIGRALVRSPRVLLLDQPLSDLDAKIRQEMTGELKRLQAETGQTMIYATHDYEEALAMADRILVIHQGQEQQVGDPWEVYNQPQTAFVASFLGSPAMNLIACRLEATERGMRASTAEFELELAAAANIELPTEGLLGIRPEKIALASPGQGHVQAKVDIVQVLGDELIADLSLRDGTILKLVADLGHGLKPGQTLGLHFPEEHLFLFERGSGRRLAPPPAS